MKLLSPLDHIMLRMESDRAPMHIGALAIFRIPEGAGDGFVRGIYESFKELAFLPFPYDSVLSGLPIADAAYWTQVQPDADYHVRLDALPTPGSEVELGRLVERLHSTPLDLTRPVWEAHVIEGLSGNRFAFYFKAHHCATDGMGAIETIKAWLSTDPESLPATGLADPGKPLTWLDKLTILPRRATEGALATAEVLTKLPAFTMGDDSFVRSAIKTPSTIFNQPVTAHRRFAPHTVELGRLKAVARATESTVNDVALAIIGGAVRRYLLEEESLPAQSLNASVPMGLERDETTLNAAIGFVTPLGTDLEDHRDRLKVIHARTSRGKRDVDSMGRAAQDHFTLLGLAPLLLAQKTGIAQHLPQLFNFTVSNVVLSKEKLYLLGAELELMAPISFLVDGYGLNVTLIGYADHVTFGFVGCRDTIPHLQRLASYTGDALAELEAAVLS